MSGLRTAALRALKVTAAAYDVVRPPARGVVVLLYHRVGARTGLELDLSTEAFADQMAVLHESGRATSLDAALSALERGDNDENDPVVVTFDDGTSDLVDNALPVLQQFEIPATWYVATDFVERQRAFPWGAPPISWAGLADAKSTGLVTVGSHTHTHAVLDNVAPAAIADELDRSRELIEDRLDSPAGHFAYPKGMAHSDVADAAVRTRFASAARARTGVNSYDMSDPYRLLRSPIQASDDLRWFHRKVGGGLALEGAIRELLNRRRYADTVT